mmetsp:Transcript_29040/g.53134  ORF Transcript_29040/g.53134 Transcript_29040/m.53134 type:complete len:249 (-) Transcript_29040:284-1030(-)
MKLAVARQLHSTALYLHHNHLASVSIRVASFSSIVPNSQVLERRQVGEDKRITRKFSGGGSLLRRQQQLDLAVLPSHCLKTSSHSQTIIGAATTDHRTSCLLLVPKLAYSPVRFMSSSSMFPVTESIQTKLSEALYPTYLEVRNESHMHNVPKDSETHFKVICVSTKFEEVKSPVQRHRLVHSILADELAGPVHALSIVAKSPLQWEKMVSDDQGNQHDTNNNTDTIVGPSPSCRGGDGSLPPRNPKP